MFVCLLRMKGVCTALYRAEILCRNLLTFSQVYIQFLGSSCHRKTKQKWSGESFPEMSRPGK